MLFQCLHIGVRIAAEYHVFLADETDTHAAFHLERPRDNARTVQLAVDNARADRKAVQSDYQTEQCCAVADLNGFRHVEHAEQFLGKIKGIAVSLLKNQRRIGFQFIERDTLPVCERMVLIDEHMRCGSEQFLEHELTFAQQLGEHGFVAFGQIQQTQLAFARRHIINDLTGLCFPQDKTVLVRVVLLDNLDECVHRERIVLT